MLKDLYNMKKNIILLSIFAISFSFLAFNIDKVEKQWSKIERKVQKKGIEYVLTDKLVGNIIDAYVKRWDDFESCDRGYYPYRMGIKSLSWVAREQVILEQCPLSAKELDDLAYRSRLGGLVVFQLNDSTYRSTPRKIYGLDLNGIVHLRVVIHKASIAVANDQFLIEKVYLNHKKLLIKKLNEINDGKKYLEEFLDIVDTYLSGEKQSKYKQHYDILARREAAGGRQLIVTYQVILEDLVASL